MQTKDALNYVWDHSGEIHYDKRFFDPFIVHINEALLSRNMLGGDLLDLGCGYGEKANVFQKIGFDVTGIDYDPERIAKAKSDFPEINFHHFKILDELPFPENTFDLVFSCSVWQYLDHPAMIKECKRVLRPGGRIILVENLKNNPITRVGRAYMKLRKFNYQSFPYNHFTYREIIALKEVFGESTAHFCHILTPLSHFRMVKNKFTQLGKLDRILLKFPPFRRLSWLTFFSGINIK